MNDKLNKNFWVNFEKEGTIIEINKPNYDEVVDKHFVKSLRTELELTQRVFGDVLGVTKKTIEKWEQGANPIRGTSARLIYLINKDHNLANELYQVNIVEQLATEDDDYFIMKKITPLISEKNDFLLKISPVENEFEKQLEGYGFQIEGGVPCQENLNYPHLYS